MTASLALADALKGRRFSGCPSCARTCATSPKPNRSSRFSATNRQNVSSNPAEPRNELKNCPFSADGVRHDSEAELLAGLPATEGRFSVGPQSSVLPAFNQVRTRNRQQVVVPTAWPLPRRHSVLLRRHLRPNTASFLLICLQLCYFVNFFSRFVALSVEQ